MGRSFWNQLTSNILTAVQSDSMTVSDVRVIRWHGQCVKLGCLSRFDDAGFQTEKGFGVIKFTIHATYSGNHSIRNTSRGSCRAAFVDLEDLDLREESPAFDLLV